MAEEERECEVDLIGHCAFCRRQFVDPLEGEEGSDVVGVSSTSDDDRRTVPKAVVQPPLLLGSFSHVWSYLFAKGLGEEGGVKYRFSNGEAVDVLLEIPPMCRYCGEEVQELDRLHREITLKVEGIRRIVKESSSGGGQHSWRGEELGRKLEQTVLQPFVREATVNFLGDLWKSASPDATFDDQFSGFEEDSTLWSLKREPNPTRTCRVSSKEPKQATPIHQPPDKCVEMDVTVKEELYSPPPTPGGGYGSDLDQEQDSEEHNMNIGGVVSKIQYQDDEDDDDDDPRGRDSGSSYEGTEEEESSGGEASSSDSEYSPRKTRNSQSQKKLSPAKRKARKGDSKTKIAKKVKVAPSKEDNDEDESEGEDDPENSEQLDDDDLDLTPDSSRPRRRKELTCDSCNDPTITYDNVKELVAHALLVHGSEEPFQCQECGKAFSRLRSLENHKKLHTGERPHKCDVPGCTMRYITRHGLAKHKRTYHKPANRPVCETCGKSFYDSSALRDHVNSKHLGIRHECPVCGHLTTRRSHLNHHMRIHDKDYVEESKTVQTCPVCLTGKHKLGEEVTAHLKEAHGLVEEDLIKCKQCPHIFPNRVDLLEHLHNHREEGILCDICDDGVKFTKHYKFRDHYFSVHQIGDKHMCEECGKAFATPTSLKVHSQTVHSDQPSKLTPFRCELCDTAFKIFNALVTHKIRVHGEELLKCPDCDKTFDRPRSLEDHQKLHTGEANYTCDIDDCGKSYPTSHSLSKHKREVHKTGRSVCETCGKSFYDAKGLNKHVESVHLKIRHVCDICGAQLACSTSFKNHMAIHNGNQPYRCHICNRGFCQKRKMVAHVRIKHETEPQEKKPKVKKIHICETCGKNFSKLESLRRHNLIHTGERPYVCPICAQPFRQKHTMVTHVKLHETRGDSFIPKGPAEVQAANAAKRKIKKLKKAGYECDQCDDVFTSEKEFSRHKVGVHDESPFNCMVCGKGFTRTCALEDHEKLHAGQKDVHCDVPGCNMSYVSKYALAKHQRKVHKMYRKKPVVK